MERQLCINWSATIEEAKQRRKAQRLTQARLAEMAGVSTPTISRFENGEKDIQLSTVIRVLSVLGLIDSRSLTFPSPNEYYDPTKSVVIFTGQDGDKAVECRISWEALADHFGAEKNNILKVFKSNRERIEHEARRQYLASEPGKEGEVLLSTEDI